MAVTCDKPTLSDLPPEVLESIFLLLGPRPVTWLAGMEDISLTFQAATAKLPILFGNSDLALNAIESSWLEKKFSLFEARLATFQINWNKNLLHWASAIAAAGFINLGHSLKVGCYCCGGESSVEDWWPDDSPWVQHIRTQFDRRTGERRLNCRLLDKFSSPKARLETFKSNWPEGLAHWPDRLALAGFVNLHNARVICFSCGKVSCVEHWRQPGLQQDPWVQHIQLQFDKPCRFLLQSWWAQFSKEEFKEKPRCPAGHYMERRTDNYYYNHWRCNSGLPKCKSFPGYDNYQNLFIECPKSECNFQVCKQCFKSLLGIETKTKATSGQCASARMDGNLSIEKTKNNDCLMM